MELLFLIFVFIFGTIVGSFLNVVIYRLHTGRSINGRSHCLSCGHRLRWFELLPLFSYVFLLGRCKACHSRITPRYFLVEMTTGLLFALLWHLFAPLWWLVAFYLLITAILIVVAVYDIRHTIIPDECVAFLSIIAGLYVGGAAYKEEDPSLLLGSAAAALMTSAFFAGLWYISKGRWMGLGDAKLAFPLALIVGLPDAYSMIVFSFLIGAVISVSLLFAQRLLKKGTTLLRYSGTPITIKSEVPFAPFMILGFLLVELFHADIFTLTFSLLWL